MLTTLMNPQTPSARGGFEGVPQSVLLTWQGSTNAASTKGV